MLLVLDPPSTGNEKLREGAKRDLLILIRNATGPLQKVAQNDKIVPCARCGGIAGDPFSYLQIGKDSFTAVSEGGHENTGQMNIRSPIRWRTTPGY